MTTKYNAWEEYRRSSNLKEITTTEPNRLMTPKDWEEKDEELRIDFGNAVIRAALRHADPKWNKILAIRDIKRQPFYGKHP